MSDRIRQSRMQTRYATLDLLERASLARPGNLAFAQRYVHVCLDLHEEARAITALERVSAARPDDDQAWDALASLHLSRNRATDALSGFERAVAIAPDNAGYLASLGFVLRMLGDHARADSVFAHAVACDPANQYAARGHGQALMRAGAAHELVDYCEAAMAKVGPRSWLIAQYMIALARLGRRDAIAWLLDYDAILGVSQYDGLPGFASLEQFNTTLRDELMALRPLAEGAVPNDVVRDATRIRGGPWGAVAMFGADGAPASAALIAAIGAAMAAFEARLGDCLLRRTRPLDYYPKAAAVISHRQSHVAPHTHACTWAGVLYYAAVPGSVRRGDNGKAGCMEFSPPLHKTAMDEGIWPSRLVRPQPGMLVIFPGYAYHQVHATEDAGERIVVTVDLYPTSDSISTGVSHDQWLRGMPQL